jgi:transglutaminase-like putative cysteine protease
MASRSTDLSPRRPPPATPRRSATVPWVLLTVTDLIAIATLARCYSGPGELAVVVPACLLVHLLAGGGRRLAARRRSDAATGSAADPRPLPSIVLAALGWLAAVLAAFLLPLVLLESHTLTFGLPLSHTWQAVNGQLSVAWSIFSDRIAPVVEVPGLVLATAWAAGAVALASEVLYADAGLPAILALVPAFDVVVFTGTLGTSTGRALELAAIAGVALAFLVAAQGDRRPTRAIVVARTAARPGPVTAGEPSSRDTARRSGRRWALPGVTVVAAVAAGVIGPVLPGATSAPLIAWHGVDALRASGVGIGDSGPERANKTYVSDLVQVAEQEISNSGTLLFAVHSSERLRETLLTLDRFDGNAWTRVTAPSGQSTAVDQFSTPLATVERRPPQPTVLASGSDVVEQAIDISSLGGQFLPTPGVTDAVDGVSGVSRLGTYGPTVALTSLTPNFTYAVRATLPPSSAALLRGAGGAAVNGAGYLPDDLELPAPVPRSLTTLAKSIVSGTSDPYEMALRLQDYFLAGHGFVYRLPAVVPTGAIANSSQSYRALEAFLFSSRTGYCQQYATAFAVLARLDGLPTRVAVGFLPGKEIGRDEYIVTGTQVHAWPEVYLGGYGWVTFEPTPGGGSSATGPGPTTTVPGGGAGVTTTTVAGVRPNFGKPRGGGGAKPLVKHPRPHHRTDQGPASQHGSSGAPDLVAGLALLAVAWVLGVPTWRLVRRRRNRRDGREATIEAWRATTWLLAAAGAHRRRAETHLEFVQRVRRLGMLSDDAVGALEQLAERMDRALYAPVGGRQGTAADAAAAWAESATVRRSARRRIAWWQQISLVVDPRDLIGSS